MERNNQYLIGNKFAQGNKPNTTSFKKGHIPWNKGVKGIHNSLLTEFKKGCKSLNKKEVGTITIRTHRKEKRQWIKVSEPNTWEVYAVYLWKKYNNKEIPKGYIIHHKNKNKLDDRIENLELLSRKEHINIHRKDLSNFKH